MNVQIDENLNIAYIYLAKEEDMLVTHSMKIDADILLDFDKQNRLVGIEVLDYNNRLVRGFDK